MAVDGSQWQRFQQFCKPLVGSSNLSPGTNKSKSYACFPRPVFSENRGATGDTRINSSDKVAANKTYSPRFPSLLHDPDGDQAIGGIGHDEPTPVRGHGCGSAVRPRFKSPRSDLRSPYQGWARHRPLGWA